MDKNDREEICRIISDKTGVPYAKLRKGLDLAIVRAENHLKDASKAPEQLGLDSAEFAAFSYVYLTVLKQQGESGADRAYTVLRLLGLETRIRGAQGKEGKGDE